MIKKLPDEILKRASLRGKEYAWPLDDIPHVIRACEAADLVNVGGQLQFRIPDGGTCECHWVEVDTMKQVVSRSLSTFSSRVERVFNLNFRNSKSLASIQIASPVSFGTAKGNRQVLRPKERISNDRSDAESSPRLPTM